MRRCNVPEPSSPPPVVSKYEDLFTSGFSKKKQDGHGCCGLYYVRLTPLSSLYLNGMVVASVIREAAVHTLVDDKEEAGLCSSSQAILLSYHEVFFWPAREIEASAGIWGTPCWSLSSVVSDGLVPSPRSSSVHLGLS